MYCNYSPEYTVNTRNYTLKVGGSAFKPDRSSPAGKLRGLDTRRYVCNVGVGMLYVRLTRDSEGINIQEGEIRGDDGEEEEEEEGEGGEEDNEGDTPDLVPDPQDESGGSSGASTSRRSGRDRNLSSKAAAAADAPANVAKKRARRQ